MVARPLLVALLFTSLIIPGSSNTTRALDNIESADCASQKDLTEIVQWFFQSSRVLILVTLDSNNSGDSLRDFQNHFVQQVSALYHAPVIHANGTDLSWDFGEKTGVLMISHSFETIRRFFDRLNRAENINRNGDFMFAVVRPELNPDWSSPSAGDTLGMARFFRGLWTDFNILNAVVVVVASCGSGDSDTQVDVGYYDPFEYVGGFELANEQSWGKFYWTPRSALREKERGFITKRYIGDFRGYPLKVNQFPRYPTAIDRTFIPAVVQHSYIYNKCEGSGKS